MYFVCFPMNTMENQTFCSEIGQFTQNSTFGEGALLLKKVPIALKLLLLLTK